MKGLLELGKAGSVRIRRLSAELVGMHEGGHLVVGLPRLRRVELVHVHLKKSTLSPSFSIVFQ